MVSKLACQPFKTEFDSHWVPHLYGLVLRLSKKLYKLLRSEQALRYFTSKSFEVISSGYNALVLLFQQLLEGSLEVLLCERVNDLRHSLFHLLNCLITTASELNKQKSQGARSGL